MELKTDLEDTHERGNNVTRGDCGGMHGRLHLMEAHFQLQEGLKAGH